MKRCVNATLSANSLKGSYLSISHKYVGEINLDLLSKSRCDPIVPGSRRAPVSDGGKGVDAVNMCTSAVRFLSP